MSTRHAPKARDACSSDCESLRTVLVVVGGAIACFAVLAAIPCPDPEAPCGGPHWYRTLKHLEFDIPEAMLAYANERGGRLPDSLVQLLPKWLYPVRETYAARREFESRIEWRTLRLGAYALIVLWCVALLRRRRQLLVALAVCLSVPLVVIGVRLARVSAVGPPGYEYLDLFRTLPGIQQPVPPDVPGLWGDHSFRLVSAECVYTLSEGWYQERQMIPFDLERLHALARSDSVDVEDLCRRTPQDDAGACLALVLRREPTAADAFAQVPLDSNSRQIALWGLLLLGDGRTGAFALESLQAKRPGTRTYAATILARVPTPGATAALVPLVADKRREVREAAMAALGADGDPKAVEHIQAALATKDGCDLLPSACEALARIGTDEARRILAEELDTPRGDVKKLLAAVARAGDAGVVILAPFATDPASRLRGTAFLALGDTRSDMALEPMLATVRRLDYEQQQALRKLPASAKARLLDFAMDRLEGKPDAESRRLAAEMLGCTDSPNAVAPLLALAQSGESTAVWSLSRLPASLAVDPLASLLEHPDEHIVSEAARRLAHLGDPRALPVLCRRDTAGDRSTRELLVHLDAYRRYLEEHSPRP